MLRPTPLSWRGCKAQAADAWQDHCDREGLSRLLQRTVVATLYALLASARQPPAGGVGWLPCATARAIAAIQASSSTARRHIRLLGQAGAMRLRCRPGGEWVYEFPHLSEAWANRQRRIWRQQKRAQRECKASLGGSCVNPPSIPNGSFDAEFGTFERCPPGSTTELTPLVDVAAPDGAPLAAASRPLEDKDNQKRLFPTSPPAPFGSEEKRQRTNHAEAMAQRFDAGQRDFTGNGVQPSFARRSTRPLSHDPKPELERSKEQPLSHDPKPELERSKAQPLVEKKDRQDPEPSLAQRTTQRWMEKFENVYKPKKAARDEALRAQGREVLEWNGPTKQPRMHADDGHDDIKRAQRLVRRLEAQAPAPPKWSSGRLSPADDNQLADERWLVEVACVGAWLPQFAPQSVCRHFYQRRHWRAVARLVVGTEADGVRELKPYVMSMLNLLLKNRASDPGERKSFPVRPGWPDEVYRLAGARKP